MDHFEETIVALRPVLLRHCYRMLGAFDEAEEALQEALLSAWKGKDSYAGAAPLRHWLFRITTNVCLNARKARSRTLPSLRAPASPLGTAVTAPPLEDATWVTAAPDALLFASPEERVAERAQITLAFVALLQQMPAQQRAVLLLKDVVGFSSEEIAHMLDISVSSVSSALHRARAAMPVAARSETPAPHVLHAYVRAWEERDLDMLVRLLKDDVVFTMPPHALWFQGKDAVARFLSGPPFSLFWASGVKIFEVAANAQTALVFYRDGGKNPRVLQQFRFDGERFAEVHNLIGPPFLHGFVVPDFILPACL